MQPDTGWTRRRWLLGAHIASQPTTQDDSELRWVLRAGAYVVGVLPTRTPVACGVRHTAAAAATATARVRLEVTGTRPWVLHMRAQSSTRRMGCVDSLTPLAFGSWGKSKSTTNKSRRHHHLPSHITLQRARQHCDSNKSSRGVRPLTHPDIHSLTTNRHTYATNHVGDR